MRWTKKIVLILVVNLAGGLVSVKESRADEPPNTPVDPGNRVVLKLSFTIIQVLEPGRALADQDDKTFLLVGIPNSTVDEDTWTGWVVEGEPFQYTTTLDAVKTVRSYWVSNDQNPRGEILITAAGFTDQISKAVENGDYSTASGIEAVDQQIAAIVAKQGEVVGDGIADRKLTRHDADVIRQADADAEKTAIQGQISQLWGEIDSESNGRPPNSPRLAAQQAEIKTLSAKLKTIGTLAPQ